MRVRQRRRRLARKRPAQQVLSGPASAPAGRQMALGCVGRRLPAANYPRCLLTYLVSSNIEACALPNSARILSSALIMRRLTASCNLFFLMYFQIWLVTSVRGIGVEPMIAASGPRGVSGIMNAAFGLRATFFFAVLGAAFFATFFAAFFGAAFLAGFFAAFFAFFVAIRFSCRILMNGLISDSSSQRQRSPSEDWQERSRCVTRILSAFRERARVCRGKMRDFFHASRIFQRRNIDSHAIRAKMNPALTYKILSHSLCFCRDVGLLVGRQRRPALLIFGIDGSPTIVRQAQSSLLRARRTLQFRHHAHGAIRQPLGRRLFAQAFDQQRERKWRRARYRTQCQRLRSHPRRRLPQARQVEFLLEHFAIRLRQEQIAVVVFAEHLEEKAR